VTAICNNVIPVFSEHI